MEIQPTYFYIIFDYIFSDKAKLYFLHYINPWEDTFNIIYIKLKTYFNTDINHNAYYTDWTTITFEGIRAKNPKKSLYKCLEMVLNKL